MDFTGRIKWFRSTVDIINDLKKYRRVTLVEKFKVIVNKDNITDVLKLLSQNGVKWVDGEVLAAFNPFESKLSHGDEILLVGDLTEEDSLYWTEDLKEYRAEELFFKLNNITLSDNSVYCNTGSMEFHIKKDRLLYLKENIGLFNTICHHDERKVTIVDDDDKLTEQIKLLVKAVNEFERNTGLSLKII